MHDSEPKPICYRAKGPLNDLSLTNMEVVAQLHIHKGQCMLDARNFISNLFREIYENYCVYFSYNSCLRRPVEFIDQNGVKLYFMKL